MYIQNGTIMVADYEDLHKFLISPSVWVTPCADDYLGVGPEDYTINEVCNCGCCKSAISRPLEEYKIKIERRNY